MNSAREGAWLYGLVVHFRFSFRGRSKVTAKMAEYYSVLDTLKQSAGQARII